MEIDEPLDSVTSVQIFTSDAQADQTLAGMYSQMTSIGEGLLLLNGATTIYAGLAADEFAPADMVNFPDQTELFRSRMLPDNKIILEDLWTAGYKIIYTANAILDGEAASTSRTLTQAKRVELKASAKFFRAYCYFYLTGFFGDLPLALTTDYRKTINITRSGQREVYQQIVLDLKEAVTLLSDPAVSHLTGNTKVTKIAAQALLARAFLYQKDWSSAEATSEEVINSNSRQLERLQLAFDMKSKETILQLKIDPKSNAGNINERLYLSPLIPINSLPEGYIDAIFDPEAYPGFVPALTPRLILNEQTANAFESGDQRKAIWVDFNPSPNLEPYFGKSIYFVNKYAMDNKERLNYVLMRFAELYLIRAEARVMQNKLGLAAEDLDLIRNRAGLGKTTAVGQEGLLAAVAQERRSEFCGEWGHRFFDLKRTGKALSVLGALPEKQGLTAEMLLFPIPSMEIRNNPKLKQNPGY
ncbi:RagB/SusD family nutrient uptake outer membrane protein [Pedobacter gandavensis]|uniref:RagB/SusD family nutrient uptake outer membrane protein n=1 Tax=Pedobacter gandavensis TaxID=2679963 RepID=UPI00292E2F64|nr:RagB/SusD family nutrient uptake outer membrane protein [Pedobacter gandavensis]